MARGIEIASSVTEPPSDPTDTARTSPEESRFLLTCPRLLRPSQRIFLYLAIWSGVRPSSWTPPSFSVTPNSTVPPSELAIAL